MLDSKFVTESQIRALNTFRINLSGKAFSKAELKQTLRDGGIPSNEVFISALRRSPVLTQVGKDQFKFATPQHPVYWGVLDRVYVDYRVKANTYQKTYREKKRQQKLAESIPAA